MKKLLLSILALISLQSAVPAFAQIAEPDLTARILVASDRPAPGTTLPVAVTVNPGKGWHIYWSNPGDSGYPPRIDWTLPLGYSIDTLKHPAPIRTVVGGIAMSVHEGVTTLVSALHVPSNAVSGQSLRLSGAADFLVCSSEMCVPKTIDLVRDLVIGDGTPNATSAIAIAHAQAALPRPLEGDVPFTMDGNEINLTVPATLVVPSTSVALFSSLPDSGALGPARISAREGETVRIIAQTGSLHAGNAHDLVLVAYGSNGEARAFSLRAVLSGVAGQSLAITSQKSNGGAFLLALAAIGGAILGGLLLNLMPCVFPILSLKAMALLRSGADAKEARNEAVGYAIGATSVMVLLGGVILALRASGEAVGWAFQLQDPRVICLLLLLVTGISVNLAGLFELPSLATSRMPARGLVGSIGTGALAAFVATPCTGPFMAGALGTALVLPTLAALGVFAGLGVGLALPFIVIGFWEPSRKWLPRPGQWMVTLRRLLSLPMFATALGLVWLLGQLGGVDAMTQGLAVALMLGVVLWWWGLKQAAGFGVKVQIAVVLGLMALPAALISPLTPGAAATAVQASSADATIPYSPAAMADLQRQNRQVLLYATAQWCLTCKVNEASSLNTSAVRAAFRKAGAVMMEADWTSGDPDVTKLLTDNARAGVPLYLWYPGKTAPQVLPQILTPDLILGLLPTEPMHP